MPDDNTDLENAYTAGDLVNINDKNDQRVSQTATSQYAIHQYKDYVAESSCTVEWEGQTNLDPATKIVFLQIYNLSGTPGWDNLDSDNSSPVNTDFILTADIADLTNYKDGSGVITCRVYQQAT